jgi:hypothetical protein
VKSGNVREAREGDKVLVWPAGADLSMIGLYKQVIINRQ